MQFLDDRRRRICNRCKIEYQCPPSYVCPTCNTKGVRVFDRMTIIAGRRFGKSLFGSIAGTEEASIPNTIGWACAPTNQKLHRYVIPAFEKLIPKDWIADWSSEFSDLRLTNGSLLHFQTLENPDQGRGQGLDWLWIDEVCELTEDHWDVISPSLADRQGIAFFTTSPRSYDWVYDKLYKPAEDGTPGYWALRAKTIDNPAFHTAEGVAFLAREKESRSDAFYRQEYEADFVIFTGAVYGSAIDAQTLRTDEQVKAIITEWPEIAPWRQIVVGLDSGADHPFGAVRLVSTEQGLVVIGEYLERDKSFIVHAGAIQRLAGSPTTRWAINKNERQAMIELAQHGITPWPAENDIVAGTERVKSWLHQKQLWFVESRCPQTIRQCKAYRWAESKTSDGQLRDKEKVFKKYDELPDCIRYALMTWPQLPKAPVKADTGRDISKLPDDIQRIIVRERKFNKESEPLAMQDVVGDFYA